MKTWTNPISASIGIKELLGVDRITVQELKAYLREHKEDLRAQITSLFQALRLVILKNNEKNQLRIQIET